MQHTQAKKNTFTRLGFIMAAAGAAVGLGNVWRFPMQVAQNGGAAFVLVYIVLTLVIAYPLMLAELAIGRHTRSNPIGAFRKVPNARKLIGAGFASLLCAGLVFSCYVIVGGWVLAHCFEPLCTLLGLDHLATWLTHQNLVRDMVFTTLFLLLNLTITTQGIKKGIEKWSERLMPLLLVILLGLTAYVLTLPGAWQGVRHYLVPDFGKVWHPSLLLSALGQALFSNAVGVGNMLVYGAYIQKQENLSFLGLTVVGLDTLVAFLAGLLVIPALYAAAAQSIPIYDAQDHLIAGGRLVFEVLPTLFGRLGNGGDWVALAFFVLLLIAALTSAISMLEIPVSYLGQAHGVARTKASWGISALLWGSSMVIISTFHLSFQWVMRIATQLILPFLGVVYCVFAGWLLDRKVLLEEVKAGMPKIGDGVLFNIWLVFIRFITPLLILAVMIHGFLDY